MSRLADFYNNKDDTINSYDLKNKFIIQYKNNCEYAIKVNLDDQPFCDCTSLTIGSDGNPICNGISQNCKQGFDQDSQLDKYKIHCEPSVDTCPSGNICNRDNLLCTSNYCICGTSKNLEENVGLKYMSEAWNLNVGKFFITSKLNNFQLTPSPSTRFQVLQPGEIWVIVPPHDSNNKPFWCFSQKQKDGNYKNVCPGVGSYITKADVYMPAVENVTRFEYNINNGVLWFNGSSVDGININHQFEYTECPNSFKKCDINLDNSCRNIIQMVIILVLLLKIGMI